MTRDRLLRACMAATVVLVVLGIAGCKGLPAQTQLHPTVFTPALLSAGELKAGIDLSTPPFGGTDSGRQAGLDLDVAAALAARLGLKLVVVDVKPQDAASALASRTVDVVMSVPYTADALSTSALAGSYAVDGPAFFSAAPASASGVPTLSLDTITGMKVGAQRGSPAYWTLASELGSDTVTAYATLREALNALAKGEVQAVGGDAFVGAYLSRDIPAVRYAGQLEPATPIGVAVAPQNTVLEDAVRSALDGLAGDGVIDAVRTKWVGPLPQLQSQSGSDTTSSLVATATP